MRWAKASTNKPTGATKFVSKGLTRSRTDKLVVMPGGGGREGGREASHDGRVTALASRGEVSGTTALKTEPERKLSPAEQLEAQIPFAKPDPKPPRPRAAPKQKPRATKARCVASA